MFHYSMKEAERMVGKFLVLLLSLVFCSLLLLVGLGFLGFSLYQACLQWLAPSYSALLTGSIFLLVIAVVIMVARRAPASYESRRSVPTTTAIRGDVEAMLRSRPATCLSLAVLAGYFYESHPKLREQLGSVLVDFARVYAVELNKEHQG